MISVVIPTSGQKDISRIIQAVKNQCDEIVVEVGFDSPAKTRNKGWKRATGDIIIFLDDDLILCDNFINKSLKDFNNYDFAQSKVIGSSENNQNKFTGATMWFKRKVLEKVGGFDEDFSFFNEDIAIYWKCLQKKFRYIFLKNSVAWHSEKATFEKLKEANKLLKEKFPKKYLELKQEIR